MPVLFFLFFCKNCLCVARNTARTKICFLFQSLKIGQNAMFKSLKFARLNLALLCLFFSLAFPLSRAYSQEISASEDGKEIITVERISLIPVGDPIQVDLGELLAGEPYVVRVPYLNSTGRTISIVEIKSTCGCIAARRSEDSVKTGGESDFLLKLNPSPRPEKLQRTITIITGSGEQFPV
jgi:hypothetical protein